MGRGVYLESNQICYMEIYGFELSFGIWNQDKETLKKSKTFFGQNNFALRKPSRPL